jgi:GT2 family glycosyltransferase
VNSETTIVIVSYNCHDALSQCLSALTMRDDCPPIIVVDNASVDDTIVMVPRDFSNVQLIKNAENLGFAVACNQGIRACTTAFILFLNPDTLLMQVELEKLLAAISARPNVGACGPRILNVDGSLQPSCRRFPTLGAITSDELGLGRLFPHSRIFATYRMSGWKHDETCEVDQLMGSCLLLRRAALDHCSLLDERFFLYFEEVDLCWRLWQAGWHVLFVADATVTHLGGQSSKTDRSRAISYRYQSLFAFYRKHCIRWQLLVLKMVVQVATLARAVGGQREYRAIAMSVWTL